LQPTTPEHILLCKVDRWHSMTPSSSNAFFQQRWRSHNSLETTSVWVLYISGADNDSLWKQRVCECYTSLEQTMILSDLNNVACGCVIAPPSVPCPPVALSCCCMFY
jgi:hypothetical protein